MATTFRLPAPAVFAALALAAGTARAEPPPTYRYFEAGLSSGLMSVQADSDHIGATGWMLGYRFDKNLGVQIAGYTANSPFHQRSVAGGEALYDFARYAGVQVVGYIPATSYWDLYGAAGVGRSTYETAQAGFGDQNKTDGIVTAGLRWQVFPHFSLSGEVSRVVDAQSTFGALRAAVDF